jgi:hypothetical protein
MSAHKSYPVLRFLLISLVVCWGVGACSLATGEIKRQNTPDARVPGIGSCGIGLPDAIDDEEAIVALLHVEGDYVVRQSIVGLMGLWAQDGQISDAKHTPSDPSDDQTWQGRDAIRHRYVHRVFPGAPKLAQPLDLVISISGHRAVVTGTTRIGDEISPGGDRWKLVKMENCWVIQELTFNLEAR